MRTKGQHIFKDLFLRGHYPVDLLLRTGASPGSSYPETRHLRWIAEPAPSCADPAPSKDMCARNENTMLTLRVGTCSPIAIQ